MNKKITSSFDSITLHFAPIMISLVKGAACAAIGQYELAAAECSGIIGGIQRDSSKSKCNTIIQKWISRALETTIVKLANEFFNHIPYGDRSTLQEKLQDSKLTIKWNFDDSYFSLSNTYEPAYQLANMIENFLKEHSTLPPQRVKDCKYLFCETFIFSMHNEWDKNPDEFSIVGKNYPESYAEYRSYKKVWSQHRKKNQELGEKLLVGEDIELREIFINPKGYYLEKYNSHNRRHEESNLASRKRVVDVLTSLEKWATSSQRSDAIRIISGGPGSGKSSLARMFASHLASTSQIETVLISLRSFNFKSNLIDDIESCLGRDFQTKLWDCPKFCVIFDGLDEYTHSGVTGISTASKLIYAIINSIEDSTNCQHKKYIITGRDLSTSGLSAQLKTFAKEIHLLEYLVEDETKYYDPLKLLKIDQRKDWWERYHKLKKELPAKEFPKSFNSGKLKEISSQPLLIHLLAFTLKSSTQIDQNTSLSSIYHALIKDVYERNYAIRHNTVNHIATADHFKKLLQEIAYLAWLNGDLITIHKKNLTTPHLSPKVKDDLLLFFESSSQGTSKLLLAFFFRENDSDSDEKQCEFTHKTFSEFLICTKILNELDKILDKDEDSSDQLKELIKFFGSCEVSIDFLPFLASLIETRSNEALNQLQTDIARLIYTLSSFKIPSLLVPNEDKTIQNELNVFTNIINLTFLLHRAVTEVTKTNTRIDYPFSTFFNKMLTIAFTQWKTSSGDSRSNKLTFSMCLSNFDFIGQEFAFTNLVNCNFSHSSFLNCSLANTNFSSIRFLSSKFEACTFENSFITDSHFYRSTFSNCSFDETKFAKCSFLFTEFKGCNFQNASLSNVNGNHCLFSTCSFKKACITESSLEDITLVKTMLSECAFCDSLLMHKIYSSNVNYNGLNKASGQ